MKISEIVAGHGVSGRLLERLHVQPVSLVHVHELHGVGVSADR